MQNPSPGIVSDISDDMNVYGSGVVWSAIFAGAVAILALSLILLAFGSGVGFAAVSPWPGAGMSAAGITVMGAIWLIVVQWASAAFGGYLAGRLRSKRTGMHSHEVFLRDTAHGFLSWALATIIGGVLLVSMAVYMIGGAEHMTAHSGGYAKQHEASAHMQGGPSWGPFDYYVDSLFRSEHPENASPADQEMRAEATRILMTGVKNGTVSGADQTYLAQLVQARTGLAQPDAETRVNNVLTNVKDDEGKMRQAADDARKVTASVSVYAFLSMLIGAFIASVAAALGGAHRDEGWTVPSEY